MFLESMSGRSMYVKIGSQLEEARDDRPFIIRTTMLFFHTPERPALYCVSYLDKGQLTEEEYRFLMATTVPIGKLFLQLNHNEDIRKENISFSVEHNEEIAGCMNVTYPLLYRKTYDYLVGSRRIGRIIEFFNEESLGRI